MKHLSLEVLIEKEHQMVDQDYDYLGGMSETTATDRYMELNNDRMGEDSEELNMRENRARTVLSERPLPSYQPY